LPSLLTIEYLRGHQVMLQIQNHVLTEGQTKVNGVVMTSSPAP
jgi:hypothetical protein